MGWDGSRRGLETISTDLEEHPPALLLAGRSGGVLRLRGSGIGDERRGRGDTLTGADWGGGEIVHLTVNDDVGQTWAYNTDITADDAGNFMLQFQLPNTFVANYRVTATGSSGAAAQTTFTDSQPQTPTVASPTSVTVVAVITCGFASL